MSERAPGLAVQTHWLMSECDRLREINAEMLKVLKHARKDFEIRDRRWDTVYYEIKAAIRKATEDDNAWKGTEDE